MTLIAFVRHGSTYWNKEERMQGHSENPLDDEGWRQARLLAGRLNEEHWDVLYSSDLLRAKQTTDALLERLAVRDVRFDRRLREMDRGEASGTTEAERIAKWGPAWQTKVVGMETDEEGMARGCAFVREILNRHPGRRILLVSHGKIIRNTLAGLVPELDTEIALRNTSITLLRFRDPDWDCELYNCIRHLTEAGKCL